MRRRAAGLFTRGVAMGTADVIPGVSGGTMALITGIYDELVATVAGIDRHLVTALLRGRFVEVLERANVGFLVPLLAGILTAIVTLAKGITWLLEYHPVPVWGALTGLIAASLVVVARQVRQWSLGTVLAMFAGTAAGYTVTLLVPVQTGAEWYKFTGAGLVASVAMILPGISGSLLLLLMGKYQQVLEAVHELDLVLLVVFGLGFAAGILTFSRLLKRLLASYHTVTMALLIFVGLTRVVAESGVAAVVSPLIAASTLVSGSGSVVLGSSGLVGLAYTHVWAADIRTFVMASCAHSLKLSEHMGRNVRPLFWVLLLAILISLVGSICTILHLAYEYGGINLNGWFFGGGARAPFDFIADKMKTPTDPSLEGWVNTLLGGGFMALLMIARHHLLWWPLHPVGYAGSMGW